MASLPATKNIRSMDAAARRRAMSEVPKPTFQTESKAANDNTTQKSTTQVVDKSSNAKSDKPAEKPQLHDTTDCDCSADHFLTTVMDQVYSGTLESLYNLLFHSGFMKKFLLENQKSTGKYIIYVFMIFCGIIIHTHIF